MSRWPELETGKNSVSPWTNPSTNASKRFTSAAPGAREAAGSSAAGRGGLCSDRRAAPAHPFARSFDVIQEIILSKPPAPR
jgi:hypothetical protein